MIGRAWKLHESYREPVSFLVSHLVDKTKIVLYTNLHWHICTLHPIQSTASFHSDQGILCHAHKACTAVCLHITISLYSSMTLLRSSSLSSPKSHSTYRSCISNGPCSRLVCWKTSRMQPWQFGFYARQGRWEPRIGLSRRLLEYQYLK